MAAGAAFPQVVGDIGGTNARFAARLAEGGALERVKTYPVKDFPTLDAAMARYLDELCGEAGCTRPLQAAIGIANPVTGDRVKMTNHHWSFSIEAVRQALKLDRFLVLNDFHALALSLPALGPGEVRQVGCGTAEAGRPLALVGPGTGLGVSGLLWDAQGRPVALAGEGGHVTLPAETDEEARIVALLRERFGHASAERALSGQGLENLHEALTRLHVAPVPGLSAAEITTRALDGSDPLCTRTVDLFCGWLGCIAGNLALTLGARGGCYIGGGIVPRLGPLFDASDFRRRFEAKGRMGAFLAPVPTFVITADVSPALIGAAQALQHTGAS